MRLTRKMLCRAAIVVLPVSLDKECPKISAVAWRGAPDLKTPTIFVPWTGTQEKADTFKSCTRVLACIAGIRNASNDVVCWGDCRMGSLKGRKQNV
ncbi:hypothetical protein MARINON1_50847 [Marinobacter salarius]|nr:hypothetical protein MBHK15_130764 [Marinobacter salarius]VXB60483.1 hypothetical protein MARINON1_50847 [Marinobacter salarius]